jgi:hypothetical protein
VGAGTLLYIRQGAHTITVNAALERYRAGTTTTAPAPSSSAANQTADTTAAARPGSSPTPGAARPGSQPSSGASASTAGATGASTSGSPADGVYVYATQGYEETNALGGARHDYPAQSTVTVQRSGCGWTERWQPLQERWDTWSFCNIAAGQNGKHFATYHEFFQKSQQQDYDCPANAIWRPTNPQPGSKGHAACTGSSGTTDVTATMVGFEDVPVAGKAVRALHVRFDLVLSGSNRGTGAQDRWLEAKTGLLLKMTEDLSSQSTTPFGDVHYEEHLKLSLTSDQPQR